MISLKHWRLNWALNQIFTYSNYKKHNDVLRSSGMYWMALLLKFFPGLYKSPIPLRLKDGGQFNINDFMSLYIYNEIFIGKCYDYPPLTNDKPVIMDVGANTGLFTLRMKQLYPDSSVFCYEPFPANVKQLSDNIRSSKLENISVFQKGLGGSSRTEKLYINKQNLGGHSLFRMEARSDDYIEIEIITLEEALNNAGKAHFDLIKIDCEGAEYEILKGITPELASRIDIIIFEATESLYDIKELIAHLSAIGFEVEFTEMSCNYIAYNVVNREKAVR